MKNEYLKELKESCKLTTKQISNLSGVPESTISRILSGQTDNPTFDSVCAIVNAMGGSLDKLYGTRSDFRHRRYFIAAYSVRKGYCGEKLVYQSAYRNMLRFGCRSDLYTDLRHSKPLGGICKVLTEKAEYISVLQSF